MSTIIYKYEVLGLTKLPYGANIIKVAEQEGTLVLWAEVDSNAHLHLTPVELLVLMTGEEFFEGPGVSKHYIDSILMRSGIVAHIYLKVAI